MAQVCFGPSAGPLRCGLIDNCTENVVHPVDNFGTVVGENRTPYGILALWAAGQWAVNCLLGSKGSIINGRDRILKYNIGKQCILC